MRTTPVPMLWILAVELCLTPRASATCTRSYTRVENGSFRDLFSEAVIAMVALPDGGALVAGKQFDDSAALVRLDARGRVDRRFAAMVAEPGIFGVVQAIVPEGRGFLVYGSFTDLMGTRSVDLFRIEADGRVEREGLVARWGEEPDPPASSWNPWPGPLPSPPPSWRPASADRVDASDVVSWPVLSSVPFHAHVLLADAAGRVAGAHAIADGSWIVRGERAAPADDPVVLWRVGPANGRNFQPVRARDLRAAAGVTPRILASAVLTDGSIVIGGTFTSVRGAARRHIARLRPDGSLDD